MQSILKILKCDHNLFTKAIKLIINSSKMIILFQLRFKIPCELLYPLFIINFALNLLNPVRKSYYNRGNTTLFNNPMIKKYNLMMRLYSL
jgi:hypothetical protein